MGQRFSHRHLACRDSGSRFSSAKTLIARGIAHCLWRCATTDGRRLRFFSCSAGIRRAERPAPCLLLIKGSLCRVQEPPLVPMLRFDYATNDWVIFAPLRKLRPHRVQAPDSAAGALPVAAAERCPFCPGNEALTPKEILAVRNGPGTANWLVRVIPNKFPALRIEEDHHRIDEGPIFRQMGGCGAHEVVIESPGHSAGLAQQPLEQIERVLDVVRQRHVDLMRDQRFQAIVIFKNHGEGAGTSLRHPHWQIIATPVVPRFLRTKLQVAAEYFDQHGRSLYADLLEEEEADGRRIVASSGEFAAFIPYAAHLPFEVWVLPRRRQASFGELEAAQRRPLAEVLKTVLLQLCSGLADPDFNLTIDTAPRGDEDKEYFQWHIRILPRLATPAGFEMGSGMSINTVCRKMRPSFCGTGTESAEGLQGDSDDGISTYNSTDPNCRGRRVRIVDWRAAGGGGAAGHDSRSREARLRCVDAQSRVAAQRGMVRPGRRKTGSHVPRVIAGDAALLPRVR